ncbi:MAG: hypothetical protein WAM14_06560 [Candidatus Nitrosopolaris sp.]
MTVKKTASVRVDREQWKEIKKASIGLEVNVSEFVYASLNEKLARVVEKDDQYRY